MSSRKQDRRTSQGLTGKHIYAEAEPLLFFCALNDLCGKNNCKEQS